MELSDKLSAILDHLPFLYSEYVLVATMLLILVFDLIWPERSVALKIIFLGGLVAELVVLSMHFDMRELLFNEMILVTNAAQLWKMLFAVAAMAVALMNIGITAVKKEAEQYMLILGTLLGAGFLVMSVNMLMVYFSIEVLSLCSYLLVMWSFDKMSSEAGLKYLLFGAASSAVMLYGISLFYVETGTLSLMDSTFTSALFDAHPAMIITASVLLLAGLLFKLAAAPLHIWAPDVYTAAPTPIVAYFSIVPKLAGLAVLMQVVLVLNLFGQSPIAWPALVSIIAMLSMLFGNFSALWQSNVKRLMAYSSIAQTGFLLVGIAALSELSYSAIYFYAIVYAIANMAIFAIIHHFEVRHQFVELKDYAGVMKTHPLMTVLLLICMVSLTGLPPTAGFTGKLLLFSSVWDRYSFAQNDWLLYLLIFGLLNTVIALFYYLKLPFFMIFRKADTHVSGSGNISIFQNFLLLILVVVLLLLFFRPDWLMGMINSISFTL